MFPKTTLAAVALCFLLATGGQGFAAKKKGKRKSSSSSTNKGFGAPPPTLDDVLAKFRTRLPDNPDTVPCPCGTGKTYGECCGPLHRGQESCTTMTDVLRSRYSAFSFRNIKYVMDTTHKTCRDYREDRIAWAKDLNKAGMFDSFEFTKLEAGPEEASSDDENEGFMEFKVTLTAKKDDFVTDATAALAGQETVIRERSRFLRDAEDGTWLYASGDVRSEVVGLEDTTLNI